VQTNFGVVEYLVKANAHFVPCSLVSAGGIFPLRMPKRSVRPG